MFQLALVHANVFEAAQRGILAQQTHHDRFAVQHRNHRNANVYFGIINADFDATVLRQSFLRDVEMAQNFYAGNDGRLKLFYLAGHRNFLQLTVNTITDSKFVLERFEMHIGSAQFNRVFQNLIYETDNRSFVFRAVVQIVAFSIFVNYGDAFFFFERANCICTDTEIFFDFALDGFARGKNRFEIQTSQSFQRVKTLRGEKAAGRDFDGTVVALERKQFFLQQNARGKKGKQLTIRLDVFERREAEAVFGREPAENFFLARDVRFGAEQSVRVERRQLPGRDHAFQQLLRRRILNRSGGHESSAFVLNLVYQAEQASLRFLSSRKHSLEVGLRRFKFGLLNLLRGFIFGEQILDLRRRRAVVNCLLQRFRFWTGLTKTAASTGLLTALTAAITSTHHAAHTASHGVHASRHNFGDQRFNRRPFRVVGEIQTIANAVHHALLHRRRIKISALTALTIAPLAATLAAAIIISAIAVAAAIVLLRERVAEAQSQRRRNRAQCDNTIQFHFIFLVMFVLIPWRHKRVSSQDATHMQGTCQINK